jgi:acyl carrier protein
MQGVTVKKSEIFTKVTEMLVDSLGVEEGVEIRPDSKLIDELGAESIDFLDIISRLERRFDITMDTGEEVEMLIREMVSEEELETGILPPDVIERLPELMKEVDPSEFKEGFRLSDMPRLYTVNSMVIGVIDALEEQQGIKVENDMS